MVFHQNQRRKSILRELPFVTKRHRLEDGLHATIAVSMEGKRERCRANNKEDLQKPSLQSLVDEAP
jgi:hypothetical protein